jgi:hypothetical protein
MQSMDAGLLAALMNRFHVALSQDLLAQVGF